MQKEAKKIKNIRPIPNTKDLEENKAMAIISYFGILFLIPLLTKKDSQFAMFHAKQGLVLFLTSMMGLIICWVIAFGASFLSSILMIIPIVGWIIGIVLIIATIFIWVIFLIFMLVILIIGIINVLQGEMKELPLIGQYAKKFNL